MRGNAPRTARRGTVVDIETARAERSMPSERTFRREKCRSPRLLRAVVGVIVVAIASERILMVVVVVVVMVAMIVSIVMTTASDGSSSASRVMVTIFTVRGSQAVATRRGHAMRVVYLVSY